MIYTIISFHSRALIAALERDTDLKLDRKLPQPNQRGDLLPQQKLQALEIEVLRTRSIIHCVW
jgi:hypothetical protein